MFNEYERLEKIYGPLLAERIATRLAVLSAAQDLGRVPRKPPIMLCVIDRGQGRFAVNLAPSRRLLFAAPSIGGRTGEENDIDEGLVDEIEVLGVE
ncbi:hypothetical protein [Methylobacterium sp. A52T]